MTQDNKMPDVIYADKQDPYCRWFLRDIDNRTKYIRADIADQLAEAVRKVIEDGVQETSGPYAGWKNNKCKHDRFGFEGCENCTDEFLTEALAAYNRAKETRG